MIELLDSAGCRMQIPFKQWRMKVLPENIKSSWNNADALAKWVLGGLRDGLSQDVEKASEHLMKIDKNTERAVCFRANVLMDLKKYKEMEGLIINHLKKHSETGIVLTNLATAQNFLGKKEFMITLEEALKLDPNQDKGLLWWAALYNESARKGLNISNESAYLMGITEAEKKFGGWRAKQYLGSFFANQKQKEAAINWFEKALQEKDWGHDLLMSITGDLGKNGFIEDALKIVEPIYQPDRDNFFTGTNLLQSYLELKQIDKGQELLDKMFAIRDIGMEERLLWYQSKFNEIKGAKKTVPQEDVLEGGVTITRIDYPLWSIGVGGKKTDFEIEKTGKKIALLQLYQKLGEIKEASVSSEDDTGRFSRAILLYLFEDVYYGSDANPSFIFPTVKNSNYVVLSGDLSTDWIANLAKDGSYDGILTGQFSESKNEITLIYFDTIKNKAESQIVEFDFSHPEKQINNIEKFLADTSGIKIDPTFNITNKGFKKIQDNTLRNYLMGLSQRLTIALAGSNKSSDTMNGERNMIRWMLDEANYYTDAMQCQLGMLGAVRQFINYNSSAAKEYQKEIKSWLENCSKNPNLQSLSHQVLNEFNRWLERESD
jgi:tetratricopeptide (TPR) repeat protein